MSSNTINLKDGPRFKVRTNKEDNLAKVCGPIEMVRLEPPRGDGGWYEADGPLISWFRYTPGVGWFDKQHGMVDRDFIDLAGRVLKEEGLWDQT
jgi:hypothetical protein